jgi:hypothetical protein
MSNPDRFFNDFKKRGRKSDSSSSIVSTPSPTSGVQTVQKKTKSDQISPILLQKSEGKPKSCFEKVNNSDSQIVLQLTENEMEELLSEMKALRLEMRQIVREELEPLDRLVSRTANLEKVVTDLNKNLQKIESNDMKRNIIIYGYDEKARENWKELDAKLEDLRLKLGLGQKIDYDLAFRLGKPRPGESRPILIKLLRTRDKFEILSAAKNLKGTNIYIHQDMTPEDRKTNALLRKHIKDVKQTNPDAKCKVMTNRKELWITIKGNETRYQLDGELKLKIITKPPHNTSGSQQSSLRVSTPFSSPMD